MKFYISDLHLQHTNVLKYDNRPFDNIEEHDKQVIENINSVVGSTDELYLLWDISRKANKSIENLARIKCKNVFFLQGNHDFSKYLKIYEKLWWTNLWLCHLDKDAKVMLCHYPMDEWFHSRHKEPDTYINIHWHSHWNSRAIKNRIDVWMTFNPINKPLSLDNIKEMVEFLNLNI
jgi:calcineurin-like phosphoesterase family protein